MHPHRPTTIIVYSLLRLGVLAFILPFFFELFESLGFSGGVGGLLKTISISFIILLGIFFFLIENTYFDVIGFSIVLIASIYKIITEIIEGNIGYEITVYLFTVVVALYFINKSRKRRSKKHATFV